MDRTVGYAGDEVKRTVHLTHPCGNLIELKSSLEYRGI